MLLYLAAQAINHVPSTSGATTLAIIGGAVALISVIVSFITWITHERHRRNELVERDDRIHERDLENRANLLKAEHEGWNMLVDNLTEQYNYLFKERDQLLEDIHELQNEVGGLTERLRNEGHEVRRNDT